MECMFNFTHLRSSYKSSIPHKFCIIKPYCCIFGHDGEHGDYNRDQQARGVGQTIRQVAKKPTDKAAIWTLIWRSN